MNDGENRVFPIQVSHQELLLFLSAVIFIGIYKNIVLYDRPDKYNVNFYIFGHHFTSLGTNGRQKMSGESSCPKMEIEGEEIFPIQVHSENVIFIAVAVIYIISTY